MVHQLPLNKCCFYVCIEATSARWLDHLHGVVPLQTVIKMDVLITIVAVSFLYCAVCQIPSSPALTVITPPKHMHRHFPLHEYMHKFRVTFQ